LLLLFKKNSRIVFEGDSLTSRRVPPSLDTWPFLRLMRWERTWADDFSEILFATRPDLRLTFHNSAVGGSTILDVLKRFDETVAPYKPHWVLMTIGNNDATCKIPLRTFREKVSDFVRRVRKLSNGRVIFLGGPFKSGSKKRLPYFRALREIAAKNNGLYIDIGSPLLRKSRLLRLQSKAHTIDSDGGHLNNVGNLIVAAAVLSAIGYDWA